MTATTVQVGHDGHNINKQPSPSPSPSPSPREQPQTAPIPTPTPTTIEAKQQQQQQQHTKKLCTICTICKESKPRMYFSKKLFACDTPKCQPCASTEKALSFHASSSQMQSVHANNSTKKILGRKSASGMKRRPNNFGYCDYVDLVMRLRCYKDVVKHQVFRTAKDISESVAAIRAACGLLLDKDNNNNNDNDVLCLCIGDGNTPRTAVLAAYWKQWTCISIDPELKDDWVGVNPKGVRGLTGFQGTFEEYLDTLQEEAASTTTSSLSTTVTTTTTNDATSTAFCQPVSLSSSITTTTTTTPIPPSSSSFSVNRNDPNNTNNSNKKTLVLLCVHSHVQFRGERSALSRVRALHNTKANNIGKMILVSIPCCPGFRHVNDVGRNPDKSYEDDCVFSACRTVNIWEFPL